MADKFEQLRVVFIFKNFGLIKHHKISHIGLGISAINTTGVLKQEKIKAEVWDVLEVSDIFTQLQNPENDISSITHVIISAPWVPTPDLAKMICEYKHIMFVTLSHSNVAFLGADTGGIRRLREGAILQQQVSNYSLAGNSEKFIKWASIVWNIDVAFLPNLYNISGMKLQHKLWNGKSPLRLGSFGAVRPLKNHITSAAAAVKISKKLGVPVELWFNSGRSEGGSMGGLTSIEQLVGGIHNFHIRHKPWSPWNEFRDFVGSMNLNLQPSFTESYNMVVSDSIYGSIPAAVSDAITWVPQSWVAKADDANDLARVAIELLKNPEAAQEGQIALRRYVKDGIKAWKEFLLK